MWLPQPQSPTQAAQQLHSVSSLLLFFFSVLKCIFTYSLRIPYIYMQCVLIKLTSHSLPCTLVLFSLQLCPDKPAGSWQCCELGEHWIHRSVWPPGLAAQTPWGSHLFPGDPVTGKWLRSYVYCITREGPATSLAWKRSTFKVKFPPNKYGFYICKIKTKVKSA